MSTRIKYALLVLAFALASGNALAAVTLTGTVRFENRNYSQNGWGSNSYLPARFVTVQILRSTDEAVLHSSFTSATGTYSMNVSSLNAGSSYKLRVLAETAAATVGTGGGTRWACTTVTTTATNVAFDIALGGVCGTPARALNIIDAIVEGYQWAEARAGGPPDQIDVLFPSGSHPMYDWSANFIHINNNDNASNDDIVLHEYGHFLWDDFTLYLTGPGGEHTYCGAVSPELAFSEAWAHFIFLAVRAKEWGVSYAPSTTLDSYQDFETGQNIADGQCTPVGSGYELAVAAVLSDTRDSADESFDTISSQQQKTWNILDHNWQTRSTTPTIHDFRTEWGNNAEMDPLFCKYISSANCSGPSAPSAQPASNVTTTSFQANWGSASGATGYRLDVSTSSSFGSFVSGYNNLDVGNATTRSVTGLSSSTTYYYRVRAYNGGGTSSSSNTVNVSTSASAPSAPSANSATNVSSSGFQANWSSASGATGYRFDVSTSSSFSSFISGYNNLDVGNVASRSISGLAAGTTYYYRVRAYNGSGTSGNSNVISVATTGSAPSAPSANSATNVSSSGFQANWSSASGATGYRLDVSTSSSFSSFVSGYNNLDVGNVGAMSVSGLASGTTYYYRVRAYNGSGTSGNSNTISVATNGSAPSAPSANSATNVSSSGFQANWSSASGATGYWLDVSTSSSFSSFVSGYNNLDVGNVGSRSVSGLAAATTYYYRVRASNSSGTSGNSNTITVMTSGGATPPPVLASASPQHGPVSGGTAVTITGSNFISGAGVTFGGAAATNVSVNNSTTITCTTPPHAAGTVSIVVTNPDAQSGQLSNAFTYDIPATGNAVYDATLRAPKCGTAGSVCDSGSLLDGRGSMGPEPNAPNTINGSCSDGDSGNYHSDESMDRLLVSTVNGAPFAPGQQVRIDATVWAYSGYADDHLDLYSAADATNPQWSYLGTITPSTQGAQTLSTIYTLPAGASLQAVRAVFRFSGTASACGSNDGYNDYDDLIFTVQASTPPSATRPRGDFNGDGKSDLFWRDPANGSNAVWLMNGFTPLGAGTTSIEPAYQIVGTGDFDGDGKADILWRNQSAGANYIWLMNGHHASNGSAFTSVPAPWIVAGVGDVNADGKADIVWYNPSNGAGSIWLMNGFAVVNGSGIATVPDTNFRIVAVADFNGDGKSDLLWRNSATGQNHIWLLNGLSVQATSSIPSVADLNFYVAGTGDFNADGRFDILWRNDINGAMYIWLVDGFAMNGAQLPAIGDNNWRPRAVGDWDGDGRADIMLRNIVNGANYLWFVNGFSVVNGGSIQTVPALGWNPQVPR